MNRNLPHSDFIEPGLDEIPNRLEAPRSVQDVELAHGLWVSVLANAGSLHDVVFHFVKGGEADAFQVEDRARGLDWVTDSFGTGGHTFAVVLLVFVDEPLE